MVKYRVLLKKQSTEIILIFKARGVVIKFDTAVQIIDDPNLSAEELAEKISACLAAGSM